ncbi:hypothetical protein CPB85DRAFT_1258488 [Mucidula mucida]|nr:hypothetical protein CPB85DRAFT_1258488 [Mucidula mucida]
MCVSERRYYAQCREQPKHDFFMFICCGWPDRRFFDNSRTVPCTIPPPGGFGQNFPVHVPETYERGECLVCTTDLTRRRTPHYYIDIIAAQLNISDKHGCDGIGRDAETIRVPETNSSRRLEFLVLAEKADREDRETIEVWNRQEIGAYYVDASRCSGA